MKEAKALSVPSAQYNEEDLPSVQLEYGSVSDKDIMTSSVNGYEQFQLFYVASDVLHFSVFFYSLI